MPGPDGVRFGALETIRSYGLERLRATGGYDDARRRHAEWFADVRRRDRRRAAHRRRAGRRCDRFEEVVDEVRAALRWALDHDIDLAARLAEHAYTAGRSQLRAEVVTWLEDVAGRLAADHPMAVPGSAAPSSAGWRSSVGSTRRSAIGAELLGAAAADGELMYALEGLGDIATYEGRLDDSLDAVGAHAASPPAERGDSLYADLATVGLALGDAYAGRTDDGRWRRSPPGRRARRRRRRHGSST